MGRIGDQNRRFFDVGDGILGHRTVFRFALCFDLRITFHLLELFFDFLLAHHQVLTMAIALVAVVDYGQNDQENRDL